MRNIHFCYFVSFASMYSNKKEGDPKIR